VTALDPVDDSIDDLIGRRCSYALAKANGSEAFDAIEDTRSSGSSESCNKDRDTKRRCRCAAKRLAASHPRPDRDGGGDLVGGSRDRSQEPHDHGSVDRDQFSATRTRVVRCPQGRHSFVPSALTYRTVLPTVRGSLSGRLRFPQRPPSAPRTRELAARIPSVTYA
jgi:hypothetical protein